jgi:phosphoglycerol transferase MdoB-like AlkP superfamily enzyme
MLGRIAASRFRLVGTLLAFYLVLGLLLRTGLWIAFGSHGRLGVADLGWILPLGVLDDTVEAGYLLLPLTLYTTLLSDRAYRSRANRLVLTVGASLTGFALLYLSAVEYYYFQEFDARFNVVATDYLIFPHEVFNDIWESYPVVRTVLMAGAGALALGWLWRTVPGSTQAVETRLVQRAPIALGHAALVVVAALAINTDSFVSTQNRIAEQLAVNGHSQFFQALRTGDIEYSAFYRTHEKAFHLIAAQLHKLGGEYTQLEEGRVDRRFGARTDGLGKLNVVVVMEESLGSEFSRLFGGDRDLTPYMDAYAQQGVWFSRMYAQGTRTVRGLEAISSSFPPIPTVSIVRRPNNADISTWGKVMHDAGYSTSFMYGGYGYFDNMNTFFGTNGYEIVDRNDIPKPRFANIWGVSDEDLFDTALAHFDAKAKSGQPFFAQIMTTSNHKPFTFRPGVPGVPEKGGGRDAGVRYADYALDYFLREARRHPWFDKTIFVIVADHGARVYGKSQIPLKSFEIPCLVWAPGIVEPQRIDELSSQIDIAPTVLGMLGFPYHAPFFGRDIIADTDGPPIMLFSHNHDVALFDGDKLVVLGMQRQTWTYRYDRATDVLTPVARDPNLEALTVAYYQTAAELFRTHRYE